MTSEIQPNTETPRIWPKTLLIANPLGFCAGVVRSVEEYQRAIDENPGRKIYSVGEPAHNDNVNRRFMNQQVIYVDSVAEVSSDGIGLLGPHGSTIDELELAQELNKTYVDTMCPLVKKPRDEITEQLEEGYTIIYFGKRGHKETIGVLSLDREGGRIALIENAEELDDIEVSDPNKIAFNSQTTHSVDKMEEIKKRALQKWPKMKIPKKSDICYATQNRQDAVKAIIERGARAIVILGSEHSSNAQELKKVAEEYGALAFFVDETSQLKREDFLGIEHVGLSAAASVPEKDVEDTKKFFEDNFGTEIETVAVADESRIRFAKPKIQTSKL